MPSQAAFSKGINGQAFTAGTTWKDASRAAQAAGFEAIEPVLAADGELTAATPEADCRLIGDQIREAGLAPAALVTDLFSQTPFTAPRPQDRAHAAELAIAALDRARWLGAPVLIVSPGDVRPGIADRPGVRYEDALLYTCDLLRTLSFEAEARNVVIAAETVASRFLLSPVEMRELIDRINSPWVRVCLNVGHILAHGYPQDWIEALESRIVRVHATGCDVDWPVVMAALRHTGYRGPITVAGPGELADLSRRLDQVLAE